MNHIALDNNGIEPPIEMYSLSSMTVQVSLYSKNSVDDRLRRAASSAPRYIKNEGGKYLSFTTDFLSHLGRKLRIVQPKHYYYPVWLGMCWNEAYLGNFK